MNLMPNHEKLSELSSRKRPVLTGSLLLFLGASVGSASAFLSYRMALTRFGIIFPRSYVLACLILGAFFGLCVTFAADEYDRFRGAALVVAIFMGALVPIDIYLILSFLAGPT